MLFVDDSDLAAEEMNVFMSHNKLVEALNDTRFFVASKFHVIQQMMKLSFDFLAACPSLLRQEIGCWQIRPRPVVNGCG